MSIVPSPPTRSLTENDRSTIEGLSRDIVRNACEPKESQKYLVDFFAGCGGFSAGAALTGYVVPILGVDIIVNKLFLLKRNLPSIVAAKYKLDLVSGAFSFDHPCDCASRGGRGCTWAPPDADNVLDLIYRVARDRQFGISSADVELREEADRIWAAGQYPDFMHPIHIHGSPSCRGIAASTNTGDWRKNVTVTTMGWYCGFVHYVRARHPRMCDSMSIEEAALPPRKEITSSMRANVRVAQFTRRMVEEVLGAREVHLRHPTGKFDPALTYWCNSNYERDATLPANGDRMFVARGWDLRSLTVPVGGAVKSYTTEYTSLAMLDVMALAHDADPKSDIIRREYEAMLRGDITHMRSSGSISRYMLGELARDEAIPKLWTYESVGFAYTGRVSDDETYTVYYCAADCNPRCGYRSLKKGKCPHHKVDLQMREEKKVVQAIVKKGKSVRKKESNAAVAAWARSRGKERTEALVAKTPSLSHRSVYEVSYRPTRSKNSFWLRMNHPSEAEFGSRVRATGSGTGNGGWDYEKRIPIGSSLYSSAWDGVYLDDVVVTGHFVSVVSAAAVRAFMTFPPDWRFSCGKTSSCHIDVRDGRGARLKKDACAPMCNDSRPPRWCEETGTGQRPTCLDESVIENCCLVDYNPEDPDSLRVARFDTSAKGFAFSVSAQEDRDIEPETEMAWDHACFGDAVMPLAAFRAAMSMREVDERRHGLIAGGKSSGTTLARRRSGGGSVVQRRLRAVKKPHVRTGAVVAALFRFNRIARGRSGGDTQARSLVVEPFYAYMMHRGVKPRTNNKYRSRLISLLNTGGVLTESGASHLEGAVRRKRQQNYGGSDLSAIFNNLSRWIVEGAGTTIEFLKSLCCVLLNLPVTSGIGPVRRELESSRRRFAGRKQVLNAIDALLASPELQQDEVRRAWDTLKEFGMTSDMLPADLKASFRRTVVSLHPDKQGGDVSAFQRFMSAFRSISK